MLFAFGQILRRKVDDLPSSASPVTSIGSAAAAAASAGASTTSSSKSSKSRPVSIISRAPDASGAPAIIEPESAASPASAVASLPESKSKTTDSLAEPKSSGFRLRRKSTGHVVTSAMFGMLAGGLVVPAAPMAQKSESDNALHVINDLYENEFFAAVTYHSWALLSKALRKYQYKILLKPVAARTADMREADNTYRVIAHADALEDILADWSLLNEHVVPVLRSDPHKVIFIDQIMRQLLKNSVVSPVKITAEGSIKLKRMRSYRVDRSIGHGAFGAVKLGIHEGSGQKAALKMIPKEKAESLATIMKEIDLLQGLHHPHVVEVLEVIDRPKYVCLVLEFAAGGDLLDYINHQQNNIMPERESARIFLQITLGVEYLHANCVYHRDLKPNNILLDDKKNVKISDFGLSKRTNSQTEPLKTMCGSPIYAAPELMTQNYLGAPADTWSLGVILYNFLTGRHPFNVDTADGVPLIYKKMRTNRLEFHSSPSDGAKDLCARILVCDPIARITIPQILGHHWLADVKAEYALQFNPIDKATPANKAAIQLKLDAAHRQLLDEWSNKDERWKFDHLDKEVQYWGPATPGDAGASLVRIKAKAVMQHSVDEVIRMITSLIRSTETSKWLKEDRLIEQLGDHTEVRYRAHERSTLFHKTLRDFCVGIDTKTDAATGNVYIAGCSVEHPGCPPKSGFVRAEINLNGWVIENLNPTSCMVTYVCLIDLKGNIDDGVIKMLTTDLPLYVTKVRDALNLDKSS
ncbi:CAMK/CAMKL/AMPK protein kinase [Capsaspora owczarzaki ATCC 30864]|uniref:CAMK/CAMKL/AMPK protein kinase n=1 Tax=Capsaspora owczarzaki (strain ATCC 30864) TaxID=595528 RepID=A0A0D2X2U6_CAPO3|nr:CAMK/CAMKL/AMPK protein kinase [Capsaspora owczarzaki ATCC 30864]